MRFHHLINVDENTAFGCLNVSKIAEVSRDHLRIDRIV